MDGDSSTDASDEGLMTHICMHPSLTIRQAVTLLACNMAFSVVQLRSRVVQVSAPTYDVCASSWLVRNYCSAKRAISTDHGMSPGHSKMIGFVCRRGTGGACALIHPIGQLVGPKLVLSVHLAPCQSTERCLFRLAKPAAAWSSLQVLVDTTKCLQSPVGSCIAQRPVLVQHWSNIAPSVLEQPSSIRWSNPVPPVPSNSLEARGGPALAFQRLRDGRWSLAWRIHVPQRLADSLEARAGPALCLERLPYGLDALAVDVAVALADAAGAAVLHAAAWAILEVELEGGAWDKGADMSYEEHLAHMGLGVAAGYIASTQQVAKKLNDMGRCVHVVSSYGATAIGSVTRDAASSSSPQHHR